LIILKNKIFWLFIFSLLLVTGLVVAVKTVPKYLPVTEGQRQLAIQGVTTNASWKPVIRKLGGLDMVLVPAGCFSMGATDEQLEEALASCDTFYGVYGCQQSFENEQPSHQVCRSTPYWIGLTAVTNQQYGIESWQNSGSPQRKPTWPRETVNWQQAADFCKQRGARLPTEAEWEYSARGPDALIYPWGNEYDINKATLRKISPAPVGEKPEGASWVGALDMSGGIGEWVFDWYDAYPSEEVVDPTGPVDGELRLVRGGDWFAHASFFVRTTIRNPLDPGYSTSSVGFRCARDFSP
jgi:formylglycine-generating enzyme required for sulfatase activity